MPGPKKKYGSLQKSLETLFSPPYWPVRPETLPASLSYHPIEPETKELLFGGLSVRIIEGMHPGGVCLFRFSSGAHSVVVATDYEHSPAGDEALCALAKDTQLLIYDGAYTPEEYPLYKGYGHSTAAHGLSVAERANANALWITHHSPSHTGQMLLSLEASFAHASVPVRFARCNDVCEV